MKKFLLTLLFLAGFCYTPPAAAQTSVTGRIVVGLAATKPATCAAGDTFIASDTPYMYVCGPANTWTPLLFGGLATTQVAFGSATNTIAGSVNFTWDNTNKTLTVTNTGTNMPSLVGSTQGATATTEGILGQCQQLGNFTCEGGQFTATDSGAGPFGTLMGLYVVPSHSAAGTLGTLTGIELSPIVGGGAGAITTSRGIHIGTISFPTGTSPVTHDGIKIDDQCAGSFPAATCIGLNIAAQSNSGVAASINGLLNATAGGALSGIFSHSGAETHTGAETFCVLNGMYVAGTSCYATIQSAVTAAGTTGSVLIPAKYAGSDTYSNASGIAVLDLRGTSNDVRIWSVLSASRPTNLYPLGNDVDLFALGPADNHLRNSALQVTSSTSCTGAVQCTATVASPTLYNVAQAGNPTALFSTSAGLILEPGTAAQEVVASFTIGSGTTLVFTTVNNHTQPYAIIQKGTLFLDSNGLRTGADPAGLYKFYSFSDGNGNPAFQFPLTNGAFPLNSPQLTNVWTCGVSITGTAANCNWRNASAASQFVWLNFANTAQLMNLQESAGGAILKFGNPTNQPLVLNASTVGGLVEGGGTNTALYLLGSSGGAGTHGVVDFRDNVSDFTLKARVDETTGNITSNGVYSSILGSCTNGELALSAGWQSTGAATVTAVQGVNQTCMWTITTGTTTGANPTVTDTLITALPSAGIVCEMNIHGGTHTAAAGEYFLQTALSATAPIFTFQGTPTAGGTTYFVTRRCGP